MKLVPQHQRSLAIGALAAGFATVLVLLVLLFAMDLYAGGLQVRRVLLVIALGLPTGLVASFVFGLPFMVALRHLGMLTALPVCLGSSAIGAAAMAILLFALNWSPSFGEAAIDIALRTIPMGAAFGLVSGYAASLASGIQLRRQPSPSLPERKTVST